MCETATVESWHAEQAAVIGLLTNVVGLAAHGAAVLQVASVKLHVVVAPFAGSCVTQVHGAAAVQLVLPCLPVCTLVTVQGRATVHMQGVAGLQLSVPPRPSGCVPLLPSGSVCERLLVLKPNP